MFCMDTSVLSCTDPSKRSLDPLALAWLEANSDRVYVPAIVLTEIQRGIDRLELSGKTAKARELRDWFAATKLQFLGRIQPVDAAVALRAGQLLAEAELKSSSISVADGLVAATAYVHGWRILTRDRNDFRAFGVAMADFSVGLPRRVGQLDLPFLARLPTGSPEGVNETEELEAVQPSAEPELGKAP